MSKAAFSVRYTGPGLETGTMDVRELAPALLAFGNLLDESNRVLNGKATEVSVRVKRFEDGSFGISFEVCQKFLQQVVSILSGDHITAATNLIDLLGFSTGISFSLWKVVKWAKGKVPRKARVLEDGNVEIDFGDEPVVVPSKVFDLYRDYRVRKELQNAVYPLEKAGITGLEIRHDSDIIDRVESHEVPYFKAPELEDEKIEERETVATLSIHSLSFKEDNKWRLSDGTNTFFVTILDQVFLDKVGENLVSFAKGDRLKVRLRVIAWESGEGLKTEYQALEILEHKSASRQLNLPLE